MRRSFRHGYRYLAMLILSVLLSAALVVPFPPAVKGQQDGSRQLKRDEPNQPSGRRLALVIGNGTYANAPALKNPPNDATDMAKALSEVGFTVEHGVNLTQKQMKFMIREFGKKLKDGGQGLFYFAGHGVQLRGRNYLIPVEAEIVSETDVEDQGVDSSLVLGLMDEANNGLNVVILDACRNNPFARSFRSASNGLAQVDAPTGTLIAYATAPGRVARDGVGRNGAYTAEFLKQMKVPGLGIEELLKRVRANLKQQTNGEQVPWESSSLVGDFYLNRPANAGVAANKPTGGTTTTPAVDPAAFELEYWNAIKDSSDAEEYQGYLVKYPNGQFADIARRRAAGRRGGNNTATQPGNTTMVPANSLSAKPKPGAMVRNQMGIELVYVPAGSFEMGSNNGLENEKPVRQVTIREGFYMGRYEVTQAQYQSVIGSNPSRFKGVNLPVETVSWDDAVSFIAKLNSQNDGFIYRLPTEAEWEYAARAGTTGDYAGDLDAMAWYGNNSGRQRLDAAEIWRTDSQNYAKRITENGGQSHPVGSKLANAFGLYDMHGNVWEFCQDWYHDNYAGGPLDGSGWLSGGGQKSRVLRGASWDGSAAYLRSAIRFYNALDIRSSFYGFRLVAVVRTP